MIAPKREIVLRRRIFYAILCSFLVLIVVLPVGVYWYVQTVDAHVRWGTESNYASAFFYDTSDVSYEMKGNFGPWDNVSRFYGGEEMFNAGLMINYLSYLDTSHANQLSSIHNSVVNFTQHSGAFCGLPSYCRNVTPVQKTSWSVQLLALATKIYNAYNNWGNYTSGVPGTGPSFWYFGPTPPDERDLQDAVTISANLTG